MPFCASDGLALGRHPRPVEDVPSEAPDLRPGDRVRVRRDPDFGPGPWPAEPVGVIERSPDGQDFAVVQGAQGDVRLYWVRFDEPQYDADGDGPYDRSQVLAKYLEALA